MARTNEELASVRTRGAPLPSCLPALDQIGAFSSSDYPFEGRISAVALFSGHLTNEQVSDPVRRLADHAGRIGWHVGRRA